MYKKVTTFILVILLINLTSASYIEGKITINQLGSSRFNLGTDTNPEIQDITYQNNLLRGSSQALTSKSGDTWKFSLNLEQYNSVLIDIKLPKSLDIILSISGPQHIIDLDDKTLTLLEPGQLEISYKIKETQSYAWIIWLIIIALLILAFIIYYQIKKRRQYFSNILQLINPQEEKIINALMKTSKRQNTLRKELKIPKASFTRYLINLEKKKLILREGEGKNKIVKLN